MKARAEEGRMSADRIPRHKFVWPLERRSSMASQRY